MKIYTRTGDDGSTGILSGKRVRKSALRLHAYGTIDELSAVLGAVLASDRLPSTLRDQLLHTQRTLFTVGADLATPMDSKTDIKRMQSEEIDRLEQWIDAIESLLPPLHNFILPGGTRESAQLHLARTVCRRAERWMVELMESQSISEQVLPYINRLSDYLFVAARFANHQLHQPDVLIKNE